MKLYEYIINTQGISELEFYAVSDLNGKDPFVLLPSADPVPSGYQLVTDPQSLDNSYSDSKLSHLELRNILITECLPLWYTTMPDADKKMLIRHYVYPTDETTPNLNLLYTQPERDNFKLEFMKDLKESPSLFFSMWGDTDGSFFKVSSVVGVTTKYEITTDEVV